MSKCHQQQQILPIGFIHVCEWKTAFFFIMYQKPIPCDIKNMIINKINNITLCLHNGSKILIQNSTIKSATECLHHCLLT